MGKKTDARIEKLIIEMYKAGITPRNISTALGVPTSTVHSVRERTGIPVQNPNMQAGAIKAAKKRYAKFKKPDEMQIPAENANPVEQTADAQTALDLFAQLQTEESKGEQPKQTAVIEQAQAPTVGIEYCIVHTRQESIYAGELEDISGTRIILNNARRVYGSFTNAPLLATYGVSNTRQYNFKFSVPVERVIIAEATEVLSVTDEARKNIKAAKALQP